MTIKTASAGAYLVYAGKVVTALPATMLGWTGYPSGANGVGVAQSNHLGDHSILNWAQDNGTSKHVTTRMPGNGSNATETNPPNLTAPPSTLVYQLGSHAAAGAARSQRWASLPVRTDPASVGGDPVPSTTRTYIGSWHRLDGSNAYPSVVGMQHADYSWYDRELTGTESDNIRTGVALPESLAGWLDTLQLTTYDPGCSFTGSISGTVLTVDSGLTGTVVQGRLLTGSGISADTIVGAQISGTTGGIGTYNVSVSQTAASTAITGGGVYTSMNGRIFTAYGSWTGTGVDAHPVTRTPPAPTITGPSGAAGAATSTANLAELATTGPTFTTSVALGVGYPTLTGTDAASFPLTALSITSWRVDPVTPFNFESLPHSNPFNITFNASASVNQACAITVTNVNEAPGFSGTISVPGLTEGVAMSAINAALLFSDPDSGDTGTYSAVGTWPTGVTVSSSGLISGTPGAGTAATYSSLRVRRTDGGGLAADSNVFAITVSASGSPPGVSTQPSNQTVTEGGVATFTAAFTNSPTGYAWEFSDSPYSSWSPVVGGSGAATSSYTTGALSLVNSGRRFRCTGTNAFGSTTTNGTAQVTVNAAPAYSALTDIIAEAGIPKVATTVYWTWFPSGRPGAAVSPVQGSSVTNSAGRATITHSVAGDGMVLLGTRPGPLVSDDRVWLDFLTLA